jgi:hypothetical protein
MFFCGRCDIKDVMREKAIVKVVSKSSVQEQKSDFAYWQSQPYSARLAALEQIRQEYHQ